MVIFNQEFIHFYIIKNALGISVMLGRNEFKFY